MAVKLWSTRTPGTAQLQRDLMVMNNKKKVGRSHTHRNNYHNFTNLNVQLEVIKMLMVVVALFTLAWLPLQVYGRNQKSLIIEFDRLKLILLSGVLEQMVPGIKW